MLVSISNIKHVIISFLWTISSFVFLNIIKINTEILNIILILSQILFIKKLSNVFYIIPYIVILSPIVGTFKLNGINLLLSDFIVFISLILLIKEIEIRRIKSENTFYILIFLILFTYTHFAFGDITNLKPLISIIQIFIIVYLCMYKLDNVKFDLFINHFIVSVILGIIIMYISFYKGINLTLFNENSNNLIIESDFDLKNFRMTFFYTNFPYLILVSILTYIYKIKTNNKSIFKLFYIILICLTSLALIASGNKTTMATFVLILFISNFTFKKNKPLGSKGILVLIFTIPIVFFLLNEYYLNDFNREAFLTVLSSGDSLYDRFGVYLNTFNILIENPHRIFIGYGPDFLTCCGQFETSSLFKKNILDIYSTNNAVDSGILTFIIEFGIIVVGILVIYVKNIVGKLIKNENNLNIFFAQVIISLGIYSTTQLVGLSKISWLIIVLIFIANQNIKQINEQS